MAKGAVARGKTGTAKEHKFLRTINRLQETATVTHRNEETAPIFSAWLIQRWLETSETSGRNDNN